VKAPLRCLVAVFVFVLLPCAVARDVVFAYWNVENYLSMDRKQGGGVEKNAPKPEKEVRALIQVLKTIRPDILGIAEMGDRKTLADFQSRLRAAGMNFSHVEWVRGEEENERHLVLLSKFPIVSRDSKQDVPVEMGGKRFRMGRGILDTTIEIEPDYRLRLVGIHLKSKRPVPMYDQQSFRNREASIVRSHIRQILTANPNENLLVFGDFNDTKNEFPVREILGPPGGSTSLRDLFLRDRWGLTWTHFWSYADVYSRIDYLMASRGLWPEILLKRSGIGDARESRDASDHRAVYTTISTSK
jgi:endonuclease/exonuclease/phosphatase family metal-dependent hydrolase